MSKHNQFFAELADDNYLPTLSEIATKLSIPVQKVAKTVFRLSQAGELASIVPDNEDDQTPNDDLLPEDLPTLLAALGR
jgi:DNA-binding MarR family transcriptional regulator